MATRNVLVVALEPVPDEELRRAIEKRKQNGDIHVHVVAPTHIGTLQWLAGDEDDARAEAEELAERVAHAVEPEADVDAEVGERDPLLAVEDALVDFRADEILVAGHTDEKAEAELRRFGLPVSRIDVHDVGEVPREEPGGPEAAAHEMTHGDRAETPFVMLGAVGAILLGVVALISLIAFLVYWLA